MSIAYLARLWASLLHSLLTWEYWNWTKSVASTYESSIQGPIEDSVLCVWVSAWITSIESPSKTALLTPSSVAKDNAVTAANASAFELVRACGIFLEQEANTEPEQSLITTPIPDLFYPLKNAPSNWSLPGPMEVLSRICVSVLGC